MVTSTHVDSSDPGQSRWALSPAWCQRPRPSAGLIDAVRDGYGLEIRSAPRDLGGSSNLNLRLDDSSGRAWVLRVHRGWVTADRLDALNAVRDQLVARGLPFVSPVPTQTGARWTRVGDHLTEIEPYVEGDDMDRGGTLLAAMPLLARIHAGLRNVSAGTGAAVAPVANHLGAEVAPVFARRAGAIIRSWSGAASEESIAESIEHLAATIWDAERPYVGHMHRQLVHGDYWDDNVLFRDGQVVAVLDLDFMEERPRTDDLALVLYYAYPSARDASAGSAPMEGLARLVHAYAAAADPPLTEAERLDMPFAIARTCLHFTRHLALRDREPEQRDVVNANREEVEWGAGMIRNAKTWQEAFVQ